MRKSGIFAIAALVGTAATAVIAYVKADDIKEAIVAKKEAKGEDKLTAIETVQAIAKPVAPVALSFAATSAAIIAGYKLDGKTIGVLTVGATGIATTYKKYAKEAEKLLGPEKTKKLKESFANKHKPPKKEAPKPNEPEKNLYYLGYGFDDYLLLTDDQLDMFEKEINYRIRRFKTCSIEEALEAIGVEMSDSQIAMTALHGWGNKDLIDGVGEGVLTIDTDNLSELDNGEATSIISFCVVPTEDFDANIIDNKIDLPWEE